MLIQELVGMNIRKYRILKKYSQEDLAMKCNLHRTYISSIELGKKSPSLNVLDNIAKQLDIKIKDLFL
jgi:hypothetical protein